MTILDLCCGTGDWTFDLSKAVGQKGKVVGLDFSENMLKVAQAKLDKKTTTLNLFKEMLWLFLLKRKCLM